ncbi:protein CDV3 homolog [Clytia hemisphaerica]|uniref:protein CDV3 homolog n=1 Tax=Clytia hemisphaerica TaxID=252671 RepID=UPI0034D76532
MSDEEVLDGFFAKKDKSKKPKKKKKTKTETVITTQSESQAAKVDEWKDFEEKKEKDFSNLKIADLQGGDENDKDEQEYQQNDEDDVDGISCFLAVNSHLKRHFLFFFETTLGEEGEQGKWKPAPASNNTAKNPPPAPVKQEPVGTHNVVGGKYVPPSMKRATMASASHQAAPRRRGAPPDIKSQAAFPTLAAAKQDTEAVPSDFEVVKRGTRSNEARRDDGAPRLETGNRYDGLRS